LYFNFFTLDMEKFRKFDDPSNGVNPFVPLKEEPRPLYMKPIKAISVVFLIIIKVPFLILMLLSLGFLHVFKYIFIHRSAVNLFEYVINSCFLKIILQAFGFSQIKFEKHAD